MRHVVADPWAALRRLTPARIALGRAGASVPTQAALDFALAHARARDAVHAALDADALAHELHLDGLQALPVRSAVADRTEYLLRPDLGRRLDDPSAAALTAAAPAQPPDVAFVIADGLSALAVQRHALPTLRATLAALGPQWRIAPVVIAQQARVALGDDIGARLGARQVVVMIGERPGLSSPDSLGLYLTHGPRVGRSDAERNCISNVRPQGLAPEAAAHKLAWLLAAARQLGASGVALKDGSGDAILHNPGNAALSDIDRPSDAAG